MKTHLVITQAKAEYVCIDSKGLMHVTLFSLWSSKEWTRQVKRNYVELQ